MTTLLSISIGSARRISVVAAAGAAVAICAIAMAVGFVDTQANDPQVSGDPLSDATAVFPTNKQNEPTIAVNPVSPNFLIAGANDEQRQPPCGPGPVRGPDALPSDCSFFPGVGTSGVYTSFDGGATWVNRGLLDDQPTWIASNLVSDGDPVIVYGPKPDADGNFSWTNGVRAYYSSLASYKPGQSPFVSPTAPEVLAVAYSDDNGLTWSAPVVASTKKNPVDFNDKEWITVDTDSASPHFGRVYLAWTEFRSIVCCPSEPVVVSVSTDGGVTFSDAKQLSPAGNNVTDNGRQGAMVAVGKDGTVYVAWEQGSNQVVSVSNDGGQKWSRPTVIGPVADIQDPIPGSNFRTNSFLSIATDPGTAGEIWAAWVNLVGPAGRVVVTHSSDYGKTWAPLQMVSTPAEGYAFFQGLDIAPNGRIDIGYQAQIAIDPETFGGGNASIDSWYVKSTDNGATWSAPFKVSSASSDPAVSAQNNLARQFYGDYNVLASTNTTAYFIYTDARNGVACPAVDQYQRIIAGTETVRGDMADRIAARLGQNPYSHEPGEKPAPPEHCAGQFGNTDAFVSVITP